MFLELGGGTNRHPRADMDMDPARGKGLVAGMEAPWGFEFLTTKSVDEIYSSHLMEHVPKGDPLLRTMNEAWRVLKPGGTFTAIFPVVGWTTPMGTGQLVRGFYPWADPTHVNYIWMPESMEYFCAGNNLGLNADYGISLWVPLDNNWGSGPTADSEMTHKLTRYQTEPWSATEPTFWGVRGGWEGVVMLRKPHAQ